MKQRKLALGLMMAAVSAPVFAADPAPKADKKTEQAKQHDAAPEVTLDELKKLVNDRSAFLIDANGTKVYEEGHIPGAVSFAKNEGKLTQVLPKDKNALIVAYCGGPLCMAWEEAAKEARTNGYTNLKHYKGGIKGWKEAKLPMETGPSKS